MTSRQGRIPGLLPGLAGALSHSLSALTSSFFCRICALASGFDRFARLAADRLNAGLGGGHAFRTPGCGTRVGVAGLGEAVEGWRGFMVLKVTMGLYLIALYVVIAAAL